MSDGRIKVLGVEPNEDVRVGYRIGIHQALSHVCRTVFDGRDEGAAKLKAALESGGGFAFYSRCGMDDMDAAARIVEEACPARSLGRCYGTHHQVAEEMGNPIKSCIVEDVE